jgi:MOSC domain-containing protein YiiM
MPRPATPDATLLAVLAGTPVTVGDPWSMDPMDRPFRSAIWKVPVEGPVHVGRGGLPGDAVANRKYHGGPDQALLAYSADHYPRWMEEWGVELAYGSFGENLAVAGHDEESVCIGDVFETGAAVLQVTAMRDPCRTLARRHGRRGLEKEVWASGRSGWYLRVLGEGAIEAGMPITLVARPHPEWTVRRAGLVRHDRTRRPDEARALAMIPGISSRWRAVFEPD